MKINVERGAFLTALNHVQSVVERRNTIPILSNVLIEAGKGELKLTATDLDIEIVEALPADVLGHGSATAPAHPPPPRPICPTTSCASCRKAPRSGPSFCPARAGGWPCRPVPRALNCPACRG